ncbi:MAG: hypothetical protein ISS17_08455 [Bacteroidales bacterium]|nr:hypothetical protein [Bacteroidales bacterium]
MTLPPKIVTELYAQRFLTDEHVESGLLHIERKNRWDAEKYISKTALFDKLIACKPHNPDLNPPVFMNGSR